MPMRSTSWCALWITTALCAVLQATGCSAPEVITGDWRSSSFLHDFPDPFILAEPCCEGTSTVFYGYATNAAVPPLGVLNVPIVQSFDQGSSNQGAWDYVRAEPSPGAEPLPIDALPTLPSWASTSTPLRVWAPSVVKRYVPLPIGTSYWVMYVTAPSAAIGRQCIGTAIAADPIGPFVPYASEPLVCPPDGAIDASPFVDADGTLYLLYKTDSNGSMPPAPTKLYAQRLDPLGDATDGSAPVDLLTADAAWEQPTPPEKALIEGPSMVLRNGVYYLFYSAGAWYSSGYGIGYATCSSPTGPCTKASTLAPWFHELSGQFVGAGGEEFFVGLDGETYMAHHGYAPDCVGGLCARNLYVEPVCFDGSGCPPPTFG